MLNSDAVVRPIDTKFTRFVGDASSGLTYLNLSELNGEGRKLDLLVSRFKVTRGQILAMPTTGTEGFPIDTPYKLCPYLIPFARYLTSKSVFFRLH